MKTTKIIIKEIIDNYQLGVSCYSLWHQDKYHEIYGWLANQYGNGFNSFTYENNIYSIQFSEPRSGSGGMDEGSPATFTIIKQNHIKS